MNVYLFLYSAIILAVFTKRRYYSFYLFYIILIACTIAAVRSITVGTDTHNYVYFFEHILNPDSYTMKRTSSETFFWFITKIIAFFTSEKSIILFIYSLIFLGGYAYLTKKTTNEYLLAFLFMYLWGYYFYSLNITRQFVGIGITCITFYYFYKNDIVRFIIGVFFAFFIHKSSCICLICIPFMIPKIREKNMKKSILVIIICLVFLVSFYLNYAIIITTMLDKIPMFRTIIGPRVAYLLSFSQRNAISITVIRCSLLIFIIIFQKDYYKNEFVYKSIFLSSLGLVLYCFFMSINPVLGRVAYYFMILDGITYANFCSQYHGKKKILITTVFIAILSIYFFNSLRSGNNGIIPYSWDLY